MVSLDVGSHTIKAGLAEVHGLKRISVLGISEAPAQGIKKGHVVDIEAAAQGIESVLNTLEKLAGVEIHGATLGFSGTSLTTINNRTAVAVGTSSYEISQDDKRRVLQAVQTMSLPPDKGIVQVIERQYIIDGYDGVKEPLGMTGSRLEVEVTIVLAAHAAVQNLQRSAGRINLEVEGLVFNPLFCSGAVLTAAEMEMGVALVDIGGETVDVSVFQGGTLLFSSVLPVGGEHITRDLSIILKISSEAARKLKEHSINQFKAEDHPVEVEGGQEQESRKVSKQLIVEIVSARVMEIAEMVYAELARAGLLEQIPAGLVLTGGGSELTGITQDFEEHLGFPVRLGLPDTVLSLASEYQRPCYSALVGGLLSCAQHNLPHTENKRGLAILFGRMGDWYRDFFR